MNTKTVRQLRILHRDIGYFYIGLIISFASSGIMMNHRENWHPEQYATETKTIFIKLPEKDKLTEKFAEELGKKFNIDDKIRRQGVRREFYRISFENHDVEIDLKTGKGEIVTFIKTPFISHIMKLHKNTSKWWIYYSDIFAFGLIVIAITGSVMIKSSSRISFKNRGWKLALAGILFPLIFLFLLA